MGKVLFYIFQSTLCLGIFYYLFRIFFRADTLFRTNRILLLVGVACCLLLPFMQCNITTAKPWQQPISVVRSMLIPENGNGQVASGVQMETTKPIVAAGRYNAIKEEKSIEYINRQPASSISWNTILGILYILGASATLLFFSLSTWKMCKLIHQHPRRNYKKYKLIILPEKAPSFSWGNTIVLSQDDYDQDADKILLHEEIHLQCRHTLDLIGMEMLVIVHWFNPAAWLLMRELREIHEYEADHGVLTQGIDATQYQLLLVKKSVGTRLYSMANGLTHSKLKNRINMMLRKRTNNWARLKLLLFVPVAAATLMVFAQPEVKKTAGQAVKPESVKQAPDFQDEWELLEQFFARKKKDALGGVTDMNRTLRKKKGLHHLFVNIKNNIMFDEEGTSDTDWNKNADFIRTRLTTLLRKEYQKAQKNNLPFQTELLIRYDHGSQTGAMNLYLTTVKDVYLQLRKEIASNEGLDETELDKVLPIMVSFGERKFTKTSAIEHMETPLPIEIRIFHPNGTELKVLKNISINELKKEIIACKATAGNSLTISLKVQPDMWIGAVIDVKEAIAEAYAEK